MPLITADRQKQALANRKAKWFGRDQLPQKEIDRRKRESEMAKINARAPKPREKDDDTVIMIRGKAA